jgi:cellobiose phosphorylase
MFRAVIEYFAGIKPGYHGFTVEPCMPTAWPSMRVIRTLRGQPYTVEISRVADGYCVRVNGQDVDAGEVVPYGTQQETPLT